MFLKSIRLALKLLIFIFLTVISQIGGLVYIISELPLKRNSNLYRLKKLLLFISLYFLATFFIVPDVAIYFNRQPIIENHRIQAHTWITKLLNRNYVDSSFQPVIQKIATDFQSSHQGIKLIYLDANFPFFNGFPLFPHLSHDDGKKLDISFIYTTSKRFLTNKKPTVSGYGFYETPKKSEFNQTSECLQRGHIQYDITKYITLGTLNKELQLSVKATKDLLLSITKQKQVSTVFIEPHLKERLNLHGHKFRFHGCHAVRHDDHIHIQIQ